MTELGVHHFKQDIKIRLNDKLSDLKSSMNIDGKEIS